MIRGYYDAVAGLALANPELGRQKPRRGPQEFKRSKMSRRIFLTILLSVLTLSGGCVYRANISQGNLIKQEDLDQLEVGMTRSQVRFLLGTPMIDDPFHKGRWDYVYFLKIGRQDATFKRWVSVHFADDRVIEIRKDLELDPGL